jgi:hypothetical protein
MSSSDFYEKLGYNIIYGSELEGSEEFTLFIYFKINVDNGTNCKYNEVNKNYEEED